MKIKLLIASCITLSVFFFTSCKESKTDANIAQEKDTTQEINEELQILNEKIAKDTTNAGLYFARATQYYQDSLPQPAMEDLLRAIAIDSNKTEYHLLLSDIYFQTGNMVYAIEEAKVARRIDKMDIDIKNKLAKYYVITRGYDNALLMTKEAHLVAPNNAQAYFIESIVYKEQGKEDLCLKALKNCIAKDPEYIDAHMQIATIYNRNKDKECLRFYDYVLKIDSSYMLARYGKAMFLQDNNELESAKREYDKMILIDKNYSNAYYNHGHILFMQDSIDKAERDFDRAIKVLPTYASAYYMRGKCSEKLGDKEAAIKDYEQALVFNEKLELAQKALESIKK